MDQRPALRVVRGDGREHFRVCKESSLSAASPLGDLIRPCSISQIEEGDSPTQSPISSRVIPLLRKSEIRDAHVFIGPMLRDHVERCNRHHVTAIRDNAGMAGEMPDKPLRTLGERLKYWRVKRGYKTRKALSNACGTGVSATAISDLESGRQQSSTRLLRIASVLKINPHHLETGEGDPLDLKALPPPILNNQHLLALIAEEDIAELSETELDLARYKFREVVENILKKRPRRKSHEKRA